MNGIRMCEVDDCGCPAAWAPKICVPPEGMPAAAPLQAIPGFVLCERHMNETNPVEWLEANNGQMRNMFALMANGRMRPDFSRAYMGRVSVNSSEFKRIEQEVARQNTGTVH